SFYMEQKGVDRNTLCADLDLKYTTVRDWLKGITYPRIGKIELLANYFNINKSDLIENKIFTAQPSDSLLEEITNTARKLNTDNKKIVLRTSEELLESQENEEETKINEVSENIIRLDDYRQTTYRRVTGVVSAGSGSIQDDDLDMEVSFYEDEIPDDYDAIAYVVGNSMEPKIKNGDYLFIKNTQQVDYNTIGIFQVDGANYVKKLRQGYLESLNPDYEDIHLDESNDIRTIGEVVSVYREK
ncbi:S24 family peptidase, partial [Streptococcus pneumoniae]|nr:S24 family peptidase [Streptococcus pneumoniae]